MLAFFIALVGLAMPVHLQLRSTGGHGQATHQMADIVAANQRPGDGIVYAEDDPVGGWTTRDAIDHYLRPQGRPADVLMSRPPRTAGLLLATECSDVSACLAGVDRLWVVRTGSLNDPLTGIGSKETQLRLQFTLAQVWYPKGLTLALLERRSPPS